MSARSYGWYSYHFLPQNILDEWHNQLVCLDGWSSKTAEKYIKHILSGNPPKQVADKFNEFLSRNGYDQEDLECL